MSGDANDKTSAVAPKDATGEDHPNPEDTGYRGGLVTISADKMAVLLDCPDPGDDLDPLLERIAAEFNRLGLPECPERSLLEGKIRQAPRDGGEIRDLVIFEGTPSTPPENGRIEWAEDFFVAGFTVDSESQKIDYWNRLENLSVDENQVLCTVLSPKPGLPGKNVLGEELRVEPPYEPRIDNGPNVETTEEDETTVYCASNRGRLRWANGILAVDEVYTISGNVGLETGNVSHPGAVVVKGDVKTGATIVAEGDIVVNGLVEPSNIKSNGSLTVKGGIVGREDCLIELGGGVHAKYVLEANINACEDVVITNEIARSNVYTRGQVLVPRGRIVAGEVTALKGIVISQAGAEGVVTTLVPGTDYLLARETAGLESEVNRFERELDKVEHRLKKHPQPASPSTSGESCALIAEKHSLEEGLAAARKALKQIVRFSKQQRVREVHVHKRTCADTVFKIGSLVAKIDETIDGARVFTLRNKQIVAIPPDERPPT